jgi:hypothetical protein
MELAKVLLLCSNLCYEQFEKQQSTPGYNGDISVLPGFSKLPAEYEQVGTLKAPEFDFSKGSNFVETICINGELNVEDKNALAQLPVKIKDVYFGFLLKSKQANGRNIIAFRGTRTIEEGLIDFTAVQVPIPLVWFGNKPELKPAKVHLGFLIQYSFLFKQVTDGIKQFDQNIPVFVTGHSLGAALATLGALSIRTLHYPPTDFPDKVHMYNFASPRVGNQAFSDAFNFLLTQSYRIVNMADLIPMVPPPSLKLGPINLEYTHVGEEFSYLWQKGDIAENHTIKANYAQAVESEVPTNIPMKKEPVTGR